MTMANVFSNLFHIFFSTQHIKKSLEYGANIYANVVSPVALSLVPEIFKGKYNTSLWYKEDACPGKNRIKHLLNSSSNFGKKQSAQ